MLARSGGITAPLAASPPRSRHAARVEHTRLQPFLEQADDPAIADPVLDEPDQPIMADRVEERPDVGVEDPADPLRPLIPYASASSASCWPRPGRNP